MASRTWHGGQHRSILEIITRIINWNRHLGRDSPTNESESSWNLPSDRCSNRLQPKKRKKKSTYFFKLSSEMAEACWHCIMQYNVLLTDNNACDRSYTLRTFVSNFHDNNPQNRSHYKLEQKHKTMAFVYSFPTLYFDRLCIILNIDRMHTSNLIPFCLGTYVFSSFCLS